MCGRRACRVSHTTISVKPRAVVCPGPQTGTGMPADVCLLERPWSEVLGQAGNATVRATLIGGSTVFDRDEYEV